MYQAILLPTDGSALSEQAVKQGVELAKTLKARVVGLHVAIPYNPIDSEPLMQGNDAKRYEQHVQAAASKCLAYVKDAAKAAGVAYKVIIASNNHPYEEIIGVAKNEGCDVICMASHGRRGVGALLLGSETQKVLTHSAIQVLVFR